MTSTIELDATPAETWQVLTDTAAHSDWNPFITELHGDLRVGNRIDVRIAPPGGKPMSFRPTVTDVEPARKLVWLGHFLVPGLFDGAHSFTLEPLPDGRTRLVQGETFRGLLVGLSSRLLQNTEAGFTAMNEALRRRLTERGGAAAIAPAPAAQPRPSSAAVHPPAPGVHESPAGEAASSSTPSAPRQPAEPPEATAHRATTGSAR